MKSHIALRSRNQIDFPNQSSYYNCSVHVMSQGLSQHKYSTQIKEKYILTQASQKKRRSEKISKQDDGKTYNYSMNVSVEKLKKINENSKKENCQNEISSKQDPIRSGEIEESSISRKRYSLPMIYKKEMTRHHHDLTSIPPLPLINENYKQTYHSIEKCLEELDEIKSGRQKNQSPEKILDLLLLNTCDLKKLLQNEKQKNKRKIIVQSRVPQDFFNIFKQ